MNLASHMIFLEILELNLGHNETASNNELVMLFRFVYISGCI